MFAVKVIAKAGRNLPTFKSEVEIMVYALVTCYGFYSRFICPHPIWPQIKLSTLGHPNIILFHKYFEDAINLYLVMECAAGGELYDRIVARGRYTERDAQLVVRQIRNTSNGHHSIRRV